MKYVYIAAPYTKDDPVTNVGNAIKAADILAEKGYIPFIPHLTMLWHFLCPHDLQFWYDYDLAWLEKCDALLRLPGESAGADNEVSMAFALKMPVYLSIEDLLEDNEGE
jgi:hypothetical protein